ncbi:Smad nuclear-interacting protein 1 [Hypsizygus marmoreus]|uniref:Smad nuclear-interacting protein 1 n=1 Tax=Hypsizygus marmoreus TaxID=39966 RepID=A0A369J0U5_HYPMA|nr:Smad nuclear-interacting protein 1 [Hypsizygus marmoreus]
MSRQSRSPPPHHPRYEDRPRSYRDTDDREKRDNGPPRDQRRSGRDDQQKDYTRDRQYGERDRERERARDRDRYDSKRERERDPERARIRAGPSSSSRRSASPRPRSSRNSERPRSRSGSISDSVADKEKEDRAKPNFKPSGLLAAETNTVMALDGSSTVLKYNEPPEARKPVLGWRLYVFKGSEQVELLHVHRQSAYLIGRDRLVADIAVDHPSCSKQHAVIQYRHVQERDEFGSSKSMTKPFIIDLESTNQTFVNDEAIPVSRYYELKAGDVIKFGLSTREYVLLHDEAT